LERGRGGGDSATAEAACAWAGGGPLWLAGRRCRRAAPVNGGGHGGGGESAGLLSPRAAAAAAGLVGGGGRRRTELASPPTVREGGVARRSQGMIPHPALCSFNGVGPNHKPSSSCGKALWGVPTLRGCGPHCELIPQKSFEMPAGRAKAEYLRNGNSLTVVNRPMEEQMCVTSRPMKALLEVEWYNPPCWRHPP